MADNVKIEKLSTTPLPTQLTLGNTRHKLTLFQHNTSNGQIKNTTSLNTNQTWKSLTKTIVSIVSISHLTS